MRESLLVVDELIDGLMAECVSWNLVGDSTGDLLGVPPKVESLNHVGHDLLVFEPWSLGGVFFAFHGTLLGTMRQVHIVDGGLISLEFSANGTFVAPYNPCNLTDPFTLRPKNGYYVAFFTG
jgi:hypothetical protein